MFLFIRFLKWRRALLSILNSQMVDEFIKRLSKPGMSTDGGCRGAGRHSSLPLEKARRDVNSEALGSPG